MLARWQSTGVSRISGKFSNRQSFMIRRKQYGPILPRPMLEWWSTWEPTSSESFTAQQQYTNSHTQFLFNRPFFWNYPEVTWLLILLSGIFYYTYLIIFFVNLGFLCNQKGKFWELLWKYSPGDLPAQPTASKHWRIGISVMIISSWRSIVVRTPVLAAELSLSCARLMAGRVTTLWVKRPLSVNQHDQLSLPSLWGQLNE